MIGFGYDSHKFQAEGKLILGGIQVPCDFGVKAHSDGDVLVHALIDALLGAAGLGDIGTHFPDSDVKYKGIDSMKLLAETIEKFDSAFRIINIDATILLEKPKLNEYKTAIRDNIASACQINPQLVNIKAKTNEKMGFVGRSEGLACFCVVQLEKKDNEHHS